MTFAPLGTFVTEELTVPAGTAFFNVVHLDPDGSRRIVGHSATYGDWWDHERGRTRIIAAGLPAVIWGPTSIVGAVDLRTGQYLPYPPDGGIAIAAQEEPVNQWGYLSEWRAHVARFAHGFDSLPGFESFNQLSAAQKLTAFRVGQTIGGHAWERLAFWTTYDPALSNDWKLPIVFDPVKKAVDAVCFECQSVTAARRLALTINATDFAAKLAQGHIHGTDRSVNPWIPGDLLTVVPATSEEVTLETAISRLVHSFNAARDYYDVHVAHEVIDHDH